ncbi:hypothetical protein [Bartonella sp. CB189]|uniref:hypothetical protein n=1 Tax=Bartonella sp. CB189 TaxID=3112254 RepID=UPI002F9644C3
MESFSAYKIMSGILAGLFTVVVSIAILSIANIAPDFSFFLGCFLSLPIFIVAFGWGTLTSFISLISAAVILIITTGVYISLSLTFLFFLPAFYASWLLGLARPSQKGSLLIWYPLPSVIFHLTNFIALISSLMGLYVQTNPSTLMIAKKVIANIVQTMQQSQSIKETDMHALSELLMTHTAALIAIPLAIYSIISLIGNLYFSMIVARYMKWLKRPRDDWGKTFRLPISGLIVFIVVCIASMVELGFTLNLSAQVFTIAYTIVISISGLAYLHDITKGINGRIIILLYIAVLTVVFAPPIAFMLLLMGIWATVQSKFQLFGKFR